MSGTTLHDMLGLSNHVRLHLAILLEQVASEAFHVVLYHTLPSSCIGLSCCAGCTGTITRLGLIGIKRNI